MNNLNSTLIEGNIEVAPVSKTDNKNICVFTIASSRFFKVDNEMQEEVLHIDIEAQDGWSRKVLKEGVIGAELRCVGRLKLSPDTGKIMIMAEHIEFRPKIKRSTKKGDKKE